MGSNMRTSDNGSASDAEIEADLEADGLAEDEITRVNNVMEAFWPKEKETPPTTPSPSSGRFKRIMTPEPDSSSNEEENSEETLSCSISLNSTATTLKCSFVLDKISEETPSSSSPSSATSQPESSDSSDVEDVQGEEDSDCQEVYSDDNQSKIGYEATTVTFGDQDSELDSPEEDPDYAPQDDNSNPPSSPTVVTRLRGAEERSDEEDRHSEATQLINPLTSSSESEDEAENEVNVPLPSLLSVPDDEPNNGDALPDPIAWSTIPIMNTVQYQSYTKYVDIGIHSYSQFYLQIYVERAKTSGRMYMYPTDVLHKFRALSISSRQYDTDKFLFKLKESLYEEVNRILDKSDTQFVSITGELFSNVCRALEKYNILENQGVARRFVDRNLRKFVKYDELKEYQKESIVFSITRKGRCLLADEYKMGKGVEAIYASAIFEQEWPLLILCRSSLQEEWKSELEKWLQLNGSGSKTYDIKLLTTVEECTELLKSVDKDEKPDIVILNYNLLQSPEAQHLKNFKFRVLIIDESHRIKHNDTKTARAAAHLIKRAKRRFLLTSNPAFGVPRELFHQLHVIDRQAFANSDLFASRYCGFENLKDITGVDKEVASRDWKTAKNLDELRMLLFGTVLIRHFRQDYFPQDKKREVIQLDFNPDIRTKKILEALYRKNKVEHDTIKNWEPDHSTKSTFKWYKKSGQAKLPMLCKFLDQEIDMKTGKKIILYARHQFVLDGIELLLQRKSIEYVRLHKDYETRQKQCMDFNKVRSVKVALLSMNLSDVSIDLSAAEMVIFTELFWVPNALIKNEDRAFGNYLSTASGTSTEPPKSVSIKYLLAMESIQSDSNVHIDGHLWECLLGKMNVLNKLGFMKEDFMRNMPETRFIPNESNSTEDLEFGDMSSGNESEDSEYTPSSDEDYDDDDDDMSSGVEEVSEDSDGSSGSSCSLYSSRRDGNGNDVPSSQEQSDADVDTSKEADTSREVDTSKEAQTLDSDVENASDSSTSTPGSPSRRKNKRQHGPSESSSSAGTCSGSGSNQDSDPPDAPSTSRKLTRRLTRSQAKKVKKAPREESGSTSSSESESTDPELQTSFPPPRKAANASESDSDDGTLASESSEDSFIVENSDDSDDRGRRSSRKPKMTKQKKRTKTAKRKRGCKDRMDSSDTEDSDERERTIKKNAKSFMR